MPVNLKNLRFRDDSTNARLYKIHRNFWPVALTDHHSTFLQGRPFTHLLQKFRKMIYIKPASLLANLSQRHHSNFFGQGRANMGPRESLGRLDFLTFIVDSPTLEERTPIEFLNGFPKFAQTVNIMQKTL